MKITFLKSKKWVLISLVFILLTSAFTLNSNRYYEIAKNLEIFSNVYKEINMLYVDDLDPGELMKTGVDAMLESLDPYTNYISEADIEGYRLITTGKYKGIGASVKSIDGFPTIMSIHIDSPADRSGMKVGDQFLSINGNAVEGRTFDEVEAILKGSPGTIVNCSIRRAGSAAPLNIDLIRDDVVIENVPYYGMVHNKIAYISLTTFTQGAGKNIKDALNELKKDHEVEGVILDLRNNGGGLLLEAVNISNIFIPKGELVVSTKGKSPEWDKSFVTQATVVDPDIKLAVLINNKSASASEIVSGVVQDYDRGVLVGQRSYGKGLVQNTKDVGFNSKVKVTTAKYYIPSGRCIQSVEYKDGEPVDIPDDERAKFQTKNGRMVLDGGGVLPDFILDKPEQDAFMSALEEQYMIFHFVNTHFANVDSIPNLADFQFDDWTAFTNFLKQEDFQYQTETEVTLESLKTEADKESLELANAYASISKAIDQQKAAALEKNKANIIDRIEKAVANKYGYERGKTQMNLRNDSEVEFAIEVLLDDIKYQQALQ